mmetsp:Transcript_96000/g.309974  ORF Transcript_96000/g.309974 Transcript_96000/m.309974 type:complete len:342 (-) Transcript_96000:626-1651(-)
MATDLCHVVQATDGEAEELAVESPRDALADGGLAHPRRPYEAHDLTLHGALEDAHSHVLEDHLLDVLEAVMVLVKDLLGAVDVHVLLRLLGPGQRRHPLQVGPADVELRRLGLQARKPGELLLHGLGRLLRHTDELRDGLAEGGHNALLVVPLEVQLALDVPQVLHQDVLAVLLGKLVLDLALELGLQASVLQVLLHDHEDLAEPSGGHVGREHSLQLVPRRRGHASDKVRQLQRVIEVVVLDHLLELLFVHEGGLQQVLHRRNDLVVQSADVIAVRRHCYIWHVLHIDGAKWCALRWFSEGAQQPDAFSWHHDDLSTRNAWVGGKADNLQQRANLHEVVA